MPSGSSISSLDQKETQKLQLKAEAPGL